VKREKTNKMQQSDVYYQLLLILEDMEGICRLWAYALHILNNQHEYGPIEKTMTLLKPLKNTSLLTPYEQFFIQEFHKSGRLVSEQTPANPTH